MNIFQWPRQVAWLILLVFVLGACGGGENGEETAVSSPISPPSTNTPIPPTSDPTPEPTVTPDPTPEPTATVEPTATLEPTVEPVAEEVGEQPPYEIISNINYMGGIEAKHLLDIFVPTEGENFPTLFMLHPGGFTDGMKEWMFPFAKHFVNKGYAVVPINYRLAPDHIYPAQLEDTFCALAWLHANAADHRLDPNRIVAFGYSSGANLSSMVGTVDDPTPYLQNCPQSLPETDWISGTISIAGRANLANARDAGNLATLLGGTYEEIPERWEAASPISHIDGSETPFLLAHGLDDEVVPFEESEAFAAALEAAGTAVIFEAIPDAGHFFPTDFEGVANVIFLTAAEAFLRELTTAETAVPPPYEFIANVPYLDDGEEKHLLDIYLPNELRQPATTLFMLHPGGFFSGMKEWMFPFANHFASAGYATVVVNYRLTPDHVYPAAQQDTFCALAWLHNNAASYGLDSKRIVAFGYSAGGNLSGLVGTVDEPTLYLEDCPHPLPENWVRGTVALAGRANLISYPNAENLISMLDSSFEEAPERWQAASPITHVDGSEAPFFLAHGDADETIPLAESESFAQALQAVNVATTLEILSGADHFFASDFASPQTLQFLTAMETFLETLP